MLIQHRQIATRAARLRCIGDSGERHAIAWHNLLRGGEIRIEFGRASRRCRPFSSLRNRRNPDKYRPCGPTTPKRFRTDLVASAFRRAVAESAAVEQSGARRGAPGCVCARRRDQHHGPRTAKPEPVSISDSPRFFRHSANPSGHESNPPSCTQSFSSRLLKK